jgi:hypothetical protein
MTPAYCVMLLTLLAVGVVGCSEAKPKTRESIIAERLKRCEELNLKVSAKQILGDIERGVRGSQFQQDLCRPAANDDPGDHVHQTLMMLAASHPKSATCSVHGPFFICETEEGPFPPELHGLPGVKTRRARQYILYRAEEATRWQTAVIPSDSVLLAEWSRQIRFVPETVDPRGPKGR